MFLRLITPLLLGGVMLSIGIHPALAHAFLDHADPSVGSTVASPPTQIHLHFSEALEPTFSTITVQDAAGRHVEQGKATLAPADPRLLEVGLAPLTAGTYKVRWRVISIDSHPTEGTFTFIVGSQ